MFIDLSVLVNEKTPIYPGDPATKIIKVNSFENGDSFVDHLVTFGTHVGTHIDAPMHMLRTGDSLNKTPIEQFIGHGHVVKVSNNDFNAVTQIDIQKGDIVLFHTGRSKHYTTSNYFQDYPAMPIEIAEYLVKKEVKMVGIDTCSIDNLADFPVHKMLLSNGVLIIENLINLEILEGERFIVYALPLKLELDGAPARVIAQTLD